MYISDEDRSKIEYWSNRLAETGRALADLNIEHDTATFMYTRMSYIDQYSYRDLIGDMIAYSSLLEDALKEANSRKPSLREKLNSIL